MATGRRSALTLDHSENPCSSRSSSSVLTASSPSFALTSAIAYSQSGQQTCIGCEFTVTAGFSPFRNPLLTRTGVNWTLATRSTAWSSPRCNQLPRPKRRQGPPDLLTRSSRMPPVSSRLCARHLHCLSCESNERSSPTRQEFVSGWADGD